MVDIDAKGGLQAIVKELLDAGFVDGSCVTCTGETLAEQVQRLDPPGPDHEVIHSVARPFKKTGGLRLLRGNLAPEGGAILKVAGVEGGIKDGVFTGRARVFNSERALIAALENDAGRVRGPRHGRHPLRGPARRARHAGAPRSRPRESPRSAAGSSITIALMTDARFSGGSVGLVIGHVAPEAYLGGPIALIEDGDTIVVDLNEDRLDCRELADDALRAQRAAAWQAAADRHGGVHPDVKPVTNRLLKRMRFAARPALQGAGMAIG